MGSHMHHASFVEGLAFHPDLGEAHGKRAGGTPFPEGLISYPQSLTHHTPDEGEVNRNILRGQSVSRRGIMG